MGLLLLYTDEEEEEEGTVMALLVLEEVLDRDRFDILRDGYGRKGEDCGPLVVCCQKEFEDSGICPL